MKTRSFTAAGVALTATLLTACGGGLTQGVGQIPPVSQANVATIGKLEFAVGTANIGTDGVVGLNVVTSFRQNDGLSVTLVNTPTITGPSNFVVTAPALYANGNVEAGADAGTNHISADAQDPDPLTTSPPSTLGTAGGIFDNGLSPFNTGQGGAAYYAGNPAQNAIPPYGTIHTEYGQPFFGSAPQVYLGGPPAYPFFGNGEYYPGFAGYPQGWDAFEVRPVSGTYALSLVVPAVSQSPATYSASATLSNLTPLPAISVPTFTEDGNGGGSGGVNVGTDSRILETMIYITSGGNYYAVGPLKGNGALRFTVPDDLGPCTGVQGTGCQNNPSTQSPTLESGASYSIYAVSYDWPMFEAEPPGNTTQTPVITGSSGQADISLSPLYSATY